MTIAQMQALKAALLAETNVEAAEAMRIRNDVFLTEWCNAPSAVSVWNYEMGQRDLFEATDVTKFDGLTAGKRDAWKLLLGNAPIDMSRNKMRKAVIDIWGNVDSKAVLAACLKPATNLQAYIGGTSVTENTITGVKLNCTETIDINQLSYILNTY